MVAAFDLHLVMLRNEHLDLVLDSRESLTLGELPSVMAERLPDWLLSLLSVWVVWVPSELYVTSVWWLALSFLEFLDTSVVFSIWASRPFVWQGLKRCECLLCGKTDLGFCWAIWNRTRLLRRSLLWFVYYEKEEVFTILVRLGDLQLSSPL